jgi:predicted ester cyclase
VVLEVFADDYVRHDLRPTRALAGAAGQRKVAGDFRAAFPDLTHTLDLVLADGDLVAARWTMDGTHLGQWGDQPPTGKHVRFSGVNIFRVAGGKVVEVWNQRDDLGVAQQLGAPIYAGAAGSSPAGSGR